MPKKGRIDPSDYPLDRVLMTPEEFGRFNPQRHEFLQLSSVLHYDAEANLIVCSRVIGEDEWWRRGHIPGRPLFPGVLQAEVLAQASSVHTHLSTGLDEGSFLGFAGIEEMRFRQSIGPGEKLWVVGAMEKANLARKAFFWEGEILKEDGTVACSGRILGMGF